MPHTPVSQLRNGLTLQKDVYLLREKSVRAMRSGGLMLSATLADKGGSVAGVMFDISGPLADSLRTGAGVEVSGQVGEYRGQLQVKLDRIRAVEIVDYEAYLPMARRSLDEMEAELQALIASIERPDLARLLSAVFDDGDIARRFTRAPAAKLNHHACIGGLLEHSLSVARLVGTATDLYPEMDGDLAISVALLHDIGKMGIPDNILMKPGPLTDPQWEMMRRHPVIGCEIVGHIDFLQSALPIIRHHHEHYDGSGYPDGLRGQEIPLLARIFSVVDAFDALTHNRPYNKVLKVQEALDRLQRDSAKLYDPEVIAAFAQMVHRRMAALSPADSD